MVACSCSLHTAHGSFGPLRQEGLTRTGAITTEQFAGHGSVQFTKKGRSCLNVRYQRGLCDPALTHLASAKT